MVNEERLKLGTNRSCIRDLFEYGMKKAAEIGKENVFDFSIGNPSVPAPEGVNESICEILRDVPSTAVHGYTSASGAIDARAAVAADLEARFGCGVGAEDLFFTCGAAPALTAVLAALGVEEAETVILAPYFPEYTVFIRGAGMKCVTVPPCGDLQLHAEVIEGYITPHTQAIIINSPNNPSGVIYSEQSIRALGAVLERKGREYGHPIYIIADEPYRELVYDGAVVPFIPKLYPNTIVCYSYSKSLSLPGERLGYVYVPKFAADSRDVYAAVAGAARLLGHVCAPSLMQQMIKRCAALRPDVEAYDKNRLTLLSALESYGYECIKPQGAFYLMIRSPRGTAQEFSERAKQKNLLIVPGDGFGCPEHLRISTCVSYDTVVRSLPVFKELIEEN